MSVKCTKKQTLKLLQKLPFSALKWQKNFSLWTRLSISVSHIIILLENQNIKEEYACETQYSVMQVF